MSKEPLLNSRRNNQVFNDAGSDYSGDLDTNSRNFRKSARAEVDTMPAPENKIKK